jgi:CDGSH-type Zn-finger protein
VGIEAFLLEIKISGEETPGTLEGSGRRGEKTHSAMIAKGATFQPSRMVRCGGTNDKPYADIMHD